MELSEYNITFQPRNALKSQVLADFIADFAPKITPQADKELLNLTERSNSKWTLLVDGSSNVNGSGIDLVLTSPEGDLIQQAIRCGFWATKKGTSSNKLYVVASVLQTIKLNTRYL